MWEDVRGVLVREHGWQGPVLGTWTRPAPRQAVPADSPGTATPARDTWGQQTPRHRSRRRPGPGHVLQGTVPRAPSGDKGQSCSQDQPPAGRARPRGSGVSSGDGRTGSPLPYAPGHSETLSHSQSRGCASEAMLQTQHKGQEVGIPELCNPPVQKPQHKLSHISACAGEGGSGIGALCLSAVTFSLPPGNPENKHAVCSKEAAVEVRWSQLLSYGAVLFFH